MLGLLCLISFLQGWVGMITTPLAIQLMADLHMTYGMLMAAIGAPTILSVFLTLPGGILVDRLGVKKIIGVAGIIRGIFGILTGFSTSYVHFMVFSVASGFGGPFMIPSMARLVREQFPHHQIGIATGIFMAASSAGMTAGLGATYPVFGFNWRLAIFFLSIFELLILIVWFFIAKERRVEIAKCTQIHDLTRDLQFILRNFDVWMCTGMRVFGTGSFHFAMHLLPIALQTVRFLDAATAGAITSMGQLGVLCGSIIWPAISDWIGRRRPFLILCPALGALLLFLTWNLPSGVFTFVLFFLSGALITGCLAALPMAILAEHPLIPSKDVATAVGFSTSMHFGGMYLLGLLGGYIVDLAGYDVSFLVASILVSLTPIFGFLVRA
jgi:MFS family permease